MIRMSTRGRSIAVVLGASALVTAVAAAPAEAATNTTFELTGGGLSISEPVSKDFGSAATGGATLVDSLGTVTVTDERGLLAAAWSVSVTASDFTTGSASAEETIAATNVNYVPGTTTGNAVTVPGAGGALGGGLLPVMTGAGVGNNTASWNPTITINVPAQAVVGQYSGTITHSFV